ncbi:hypothetical protein ACO0QE_003440 [Hanseniaspora vineae]
MLRFVQGPSNTFLKQRVSNNIVHQASKNYLHPGNTSSAAAASQQPTFIPQSIHLDRSLSQERQYTTGASTTSTTGTTTSNNSTNTYQHNPAFNNNKTNSYSQNYNYNKNKKFSKNENKKNQLKSTHMQKHLNFTKIDTESPLYEQFQQFDKYITQSLQISTQQSSSLDHKGRTKQSFQFQKNPLYWDSVTQSMRLYREINASQEFGPERLSSLIHLLHNGLRINRFQLARMSKKPDYDSSSFHKQITNFIYESLKEISDDILINDMKINEFGLMHLITCFKELLLEEEAVEVWNKGLQKINAPGITPEQVHQIKNIYLNSKVVGTVLPLLNNQGLPFEESYKLYKESMSLSSPTQYSNLILGMLLVCLRMGANKKALDLFSDLFSIAQKNHFGYLIEAHLAFIGECKDLNVANDFFQKAILGDMPYKVDLQVSFVKKFMNNTWTLTRDFSKVYDIWLQASKFYGSYVHHGISSSLNDEFFNIFFEAFPGQARAETSEANTTTSDASVYTSRANSLNSATSTREQLLEQGFQQLQDIIVTYNSIKQIDEPFFNIILSKASAQWRDAKILEFIDQSYQIYNTKKTIIAYRISLKSLGFINNVTQQAIWKKWDELLAKIDETGQSYIANADWAALRDSTLTWANENILKLNSLKQRNLNEKLITPGVTSQDVTTGDVSYTGNNAAATSTASSGATTPTYTEEYNPALQALKESGAFEMETSDDELSSKMQEDDAAERSFESISGSATPVSHMEQEIAQLETDIRMRIDTYWDVFAQYSKYCRDLNQLKKLSNGYVKKFGALDPYLTSSKNMFETKHREEPVNTVFVNIKPFNE